MMSIATPMEYLKSIVTNYTASLFIISGIGLFFFHTSTNSHKEFPKEATIAKFGAIGYMILGIGLVITKLFL